MRGHHGQPVLTVVALFVLLSGCGPSDSSLPLPTAPGPLPPSPTSDPPSKVLPGPGITLSGTIFEVFPDGTRRPVGARQVAVEVDVATPLDPQRGGWVRVGLDGRYRVSGVPDNRFVKISSVDITGAARYRFCATNTITSGDTELDIALFQPGAVLPTPTLSGQISAMISDELVPLAGAEIYFRSRAFGPDVWHLTDADGRYSLCGIPRIPGELYMVCGNDVTAYSRTVDIRADAVVDIDATAFYRCLELLK